MNERAVVLGLLLATLCSCHRSVPRDRVCFRQHCFNVEIAASWEDRQQGLMFRRSLPPAHGMLFIFPESGAHRFWMKNTLVPLDIIWLDHARRIVHIANEVPPCQADPCPLVEPEHQALYVLEINAGEAGRLGMQEGDSLIFQVDNFLKK